MRADQVIVHKAAVNSLAGDWNVFNPGEYLDVYPHQAGLFLIERTLVSIFGNRLSVRVFQVSNAVALVVFYAAAVGIMGKMGAGRLPRLLALTLGLVFAPLWQYVTFVYGNMWCLGLTTLALYFELVFLQDGQRIAAAVASVAAVVLALGFKDSGKIVVIAMIILCLLARRCDPANGGAHFAPRAMPVWIPRVAYAGALVAVLLFWSAVPRAICRSMSGQDLNQGASAWSYLAMGIQEGDMECGWYTGYSIDSYKEAGFNTEAQSAIAKRLIADRLHDFAENPSSCVRFYARKIASQWNNPSFQGLWILQLLNPSADLSPLARRLMEQRFTSQEVFVLNFVQAIILFGALAWALFVPWSGDGADARNVVLALVVLGGFVCHMFWEAKCQYALVYFVLLIPLAAIGYSSIVRAILRRRRPRVEAPKVVVVALFAALWLAFVFTGGLRVVTCDAEAYETYLASDPVPAILGK